MDKYLMYLRKSRSDDPNETVEQVLAKHERILQNYASAMLDQKIPEECIYREVVSGETIEDRPEIKRLFELMQSNTIKGVLVVDCQRLSRGDLIDCGTILQNFKYTNTLIVTPKKTFDLSNEYDYKSVKSELMAGSDYLDYMKTIMQRGTLQSVLEGNYLPTRTPFGYKKVKEGKRRQYLVPDPETAPYVKFIYEKILEGYSAHAIGLMLDDLGVKPFMAKYWHERTIKRILSNEVYIGCTVWNRHKVEKRIVDGKLKKVRVRQEKPLIVHDTHEPIISKEMFDSVKKLMVSKSVKVNMSKELKSPYAGLLRCKLCGRMMRYQGEKGRNVPRYDCSGIRHCRNMSTNATVVDNAIIEALKSNLEDFKIKFNKTDEEQIQTKKNMISDLKKSLDKIDQKKERIYEFLEDGTYTKEKFIERINKLEIEKKGIETSINKIGSTMPNRNEWKEKYATLNEAIDMLQNPNISAKSKNTFLKKFIKVIYYEKHERDSSAPRHGAVTHSKNVNIEIILK